MYFRFSYTNLTSLPLDFSEEFPALREVGVRQNSITTFHEESLQHLRKNGTEVSLAGKLVYLYTRFCALFYVRV